MTTEERLEQLEQAVDRAKRLRRWMLAAAALVLVAWLAGWAFRPAAATAQSAEAAPKVVRANSFILEDEDGRVRAKLFTLMNMPFLIFYDERGEERLALHVTKAGPWLSLKDEKGQLRVVLSTRKQGPGLEEGPGLAFYDEQKNRRVKMSVDTDGPELRLYDTSGGSRVVLYSQDKLQGLAILDDREKVRVDLTANLEPKSKDKPTPVECSPLLRMFDKEGDACVVVSENRGCSVMSLRHPDDKKSRITLGIGGDNPGVWLTDSEGETIWSAP